jgi:hypothetical protein
MINTLADLVDAGTGTSTGKIKIYDGDMPETANTAVTTQVLLAELTFHAPPAFGAGSAGVATADAIADGTVIPTGTSTASWARVVDRDGAVIMDGDVGTSGCFINLNTTSLVEGGSVRITSLTLTMPNGVA